MEFSASFIRKLAAHLAVVSFWGAVLPAGAQPGANVSVGAHSAAGDSARVAQVNVGLWGRTDTVRGLQLELLRADVRGELRGVNVGAVSAVTFGEARGVQLGTFFNAVGGGMRGVQASAMASVAGGELRGVQVGGLSSIALKPFRGLQLSGVTNIAQGADGGLQLATAANISAATMRGGQLAAYNYADSLRGWQVGLVNVALSHPRGWQVGVVNIARDGGGHHVGLVNIGPDTRTDFLVYGGTSSKLNVAARFRDGGTQSVVGVGTHYMGLDRKFSGALFYRYGWYKDVAPRWTLSADAGYYHIETFERRSSARPSRLFSLQARVQADWWLNDRAGVFAAAGFGTTRHYHHLSHYRSRPIVELGIIASAPTPASPPTSLRVEGGVDNLPGTSVTAPLSNRRWAGGEAAGVGAGPRPYLLAAAGVTGINLLVHGFDRFVMDEDFAQVNLHTIHRNFKKGFVWDNDQFSTNLFAHPYHGSLYFNAARSQGLTFWQSAPYALGGSLMWEFFGEIEPPAINDVMATTFGGICLGEVTHRISDLILRPKSRGFRRFLREFAATAVCPMKGFHRICTGEAWRLGEAEEEARRLAERPDVDLALTLGSRYLADDGALFRGEHNPFLNLFLEYGDPLDESGGEARPYDFFSLEATVGMSSNQPLVNRLHILGRLWSRPIDTRSALRAEFGLYQHFNYYDSKPVRDGTDLTPYRISEAAAAGPGLILALPQMGALERLEQRLFASAILLGGTKSDYYNIIDRDYNMGSGFSLKGKTHLEFRHFGRFILHAAYFRLFTWKGYEGKDLATVNPLYLNAQGDKGNAALFVLNPHWEFDTGRGFSLCAAASYFARRTHYARHADVRARTFEASLGLTYHFF